MAPVRSMRATGTAGLGAHWWRDNRPDFPGLAVWVDAIAEIEIDAEVFGTRDESGDGDGASGAGERGGESADSEWAAGRRHAEWADGEPGARRGGGHTDGERIDREWADGESDARRGGRHIDGESGARRGGEHADGERTTGRRRGGEWSDGEWAAGASRGAEWSDGAWVADDPDAGARSQDSDDAAEPVPRVVEAMSPEYRQVWRPLSGSGREPRPGLLLSVVRAGAVVAYPTPLSDPPTGALARALARLERPTSAVAERRPEVLPVEAAPARPRRTAPAPPKTYGEVRALVGVLIEILVGRRAATHAARWTDPEVRGKLRAPRYARTASLKSVRLAESGDGVEALALLQDGGRTRVVALRFDRAEDSRWRCTALQIG